MSKDYNITVTEEVRQFNITVTDNCNVTNITPTIISNANSGSTSNGSDLINFYDSSIIALSNRITENEAVVDRKLRIVQNELDEETITPLFFWINSAHKGNTLYPLIPEDETSDITLISGNLSIINNAINVTSTDVFEVNIPNGVTEIIETINGVETTLKGNEVSIPISNSNWYGDSIDYYIGVDDIVLNDYSGGVNIFNNLAFIAGRSYVVSFNIDALIWGGLTVSLKGGVNVVSNEIYSDGNYSIEFVAKEGNNKVSINTGFFGCDCSISNFAVKEVSPFVLGGKHQLSEGLINKIIMK